MRIGHLPSGLGRKLATVAVLCSALVAGATATVPAYAAAATVAADEVGDPPLADYGDDVPADDDPSRVSASAVSTTGIPCDANGSDKTLTRAQVLARARTWLDVWVPYSQQRCYRNSLGDYRTDCSGYVSMAWGIGGSGSGIWTGNMTSKTSAIARSALKPGDALLRYTGSPSQNHVALFVRWADDAQTRPYVYEQRGSRGTVASTWSASKASAYTPVRYDNIIDVAPQPAKERTVGDYNGDGQTDRALYRPSTGEWRIQYYRTNGTAVYTWGSPGDVPVPGDYNGDGQNDRAVYRPSTGEWLIQYYRTNGTAIWKWGSPGDVPVPGDYNGDGQNDRAVYRPSTGQWLIQYYRTNGTATWDWGSPGDKPIPGDYNGDGQTDRAVYRPSTGEWLIQYYGSNGTAAYTWGQPTDVPVQGDYNGDGQTDRAVYRPSTGEWLIQYYRTNGTAIWKWGSPGDVPAVGDYNGDGQFDRAVFRPSTGQWLIQYYRTNGTATWTWGASGDIPVTAS